MMKRRISIAPPEVWELVKECYEFHDVRTKAFKTVNKKEILPRADFMNLEAKTAQELHDIGMACNPITAQDAALPVFEANVFVDAGCDALYDLLQPAKPYRADMSIYGFEALFIAGDYNIISCLITLHDCNESSGGSSEVGVVTFTDLGDDGIAIDPVCLDETYEWLCDYASITAISEWLYYLWQGVQYRLSNRPELVRVTHERFSKDEINAAKHNTGKKKRLVKVQRIITIYADEDTSVELTHGKHNITVRLWGVSGHWRTCKSGKRVWIAPYHKGVDRGKTDSYEYKEYRFTEEV
jgi:hypothetical protein